MFDDLKQPTDMFSETDRVLPQPTPPTQLQPPQPQPLDIPAPEIPAQAPVHTSGMWKIVIVVVAILVVLGAVFFVSMRLLRSNAPVTPEPPKQLNQEKTIPLPEPEAVPVTESVSEPESEVIQIEPVVEVDTDKDGLSDQMEITLGTSLVSIDTDQDGLFDREEVEVYNTDPLNPDTDADTYLDGSEVKAGYNPNGPGMLRAIPTE